MGIVNASGTIVARYTYDPWGKVLAVRNVAGAIVTSSTHVGNINPIRYRGYYYDSETGLYYLNSRYYDPEVGRFVNADAYVQTGTGIMDKNMYAYCNDDPVNMTDSCGYAPYRNEPRFLGPFSVLTPQQQQEHQKIFGTQAKNTEDIIGIDSEFSVGFFDVTAGSKTTITHSSSSNSTITAYADSGSKKVGVSASGKNVSGDWSVGKSGASAKAIFNVDGQNFSIQTTEKLYRMELTVAWSTPDTINGSTYFTIGINKWVFALAAVAPAVVAIPWDSVAKAFS